MRNLLILISLLLTSCATVSLNDFESYTNEDLSEELVVGAEEVCNYNFKKVVADGLYTQEVVDKSIQGGSMRICIQDIGNYLLTDVKKDWASIDGRWYRRSDLQKLNNQIDWGELLVEGTVFALQVEAEYQREKELKMLRAEVNALKKRVNKPYVAPKLPPR